MTILFYILIIIFGSIIIGNVFTYPMQWYFISFPEKLEQDYTYTFDADFKELNIAGEKNGMLNLLWFKTKETNKKGLILYFHGNSKNLADWGTLHSQFLPLGYDFIVYDYRKFGKSRGRLNQSLFYEDAEVVLNFAREHYEDKDIVIYGRSMGSAPACYIASKMNAKKLILETPFYSMKDLFYTYYPFFPGVFLFKFVLPNYEYLKRTSSPVLILHGTKDKTVPLSCAIKLKECLKENNKFVIIPGGGHRDLNTFAEFNEEVREFLS